MGRVLDLTARGQHRSVRVEVGTSYELLVSLCAFCHSPADVATFEGGTTWRKDVGRRASAELLDGIERLGRRAGKMWVNLLGVAVQLPTARLVPAFLERIAAMDAVELRFTLLGGHVPAYQSTVHRDVIVRAARGDVDAARTIRRDASFFSGEARLLDPVLKLTPADTRRLVNDVLRRWYEEVFRATEPRTAETLAADAAHRRADIECDEPRRAIEHVTGVDLVHDAAIDEVVLIPQLAMRPWLLLCEYDSTRLFCYPAGLETERSPGAHLLAFGRALADPKRIQILEAIARAPARVAELSARFNLPTSTTYHHLAILRAAGLVRVTSDIDRRYSIRADALDDVIAVLRGLSPTPDHQGGEG